MEELYSLSYNLFSFTHLNSSIQWQQSKLNWFWERDANSKFFHGLMSSKKQSNAIIMINVNGLQLRV